MFRLGLLIFGAAALVSTAARADEPVKLEGRWNTVNGPATISRDTSGVYSIAFEKFPGKVTGTLAADNVFTGKWWDVVTSTPCETDSEGTKHWGGLRISFYGPPNIEKPAFQGIWTYCEIPPTELKEGVTTIEGSNFAGESAE